VRQPAISHLEIRHQDKKLPAMKSSSLFFLILLIALNLSPSYLSGAKQPVEKNNGVVTMDKMDVTGIRYQWRYAKTAHFEILADTNDSKTLASIIQRTEQLLNLFESRCSLFVLHRDLPVKIIFISEQGIDRFFSVFDEKDKKQLAHDMLGVPAKGTNIHTFLIQTLAKASNEHVVMAHLSADASMSGGSYSENLGNDISIEIAQAYWSACFNIANLNISLPAFLPYLRGHCLPQHSSFDLNSFTILSKFHYYMIWPLDIIIEKRGVAFKRYDLEFERRQERLRKGKEYHGLSKEQKYDWDKKFTEKMAAGPTISLGGVLEKLDFYLDIISQREVEEEKIFLGMKKTNPFLFQIYRANEEGPNLTTGDNSETTYEDHLIMRRELYDFAYYCVFGPNPKNREAYANLVLDARKRPLTEEIFKHYFGVGYDEFSKEMCDFYRSLAPSSGAWGPDTFTISKFTDKDLPPLPEFHAAERNQSARIISDWFAVNNQPAIARQVLQLADENAPWVRKDPEFLATYGLNQAQPGGDPDKAMALLEQAASANITRPEVYRTLASLRLESIMETKGSAYRLSQPEVDAILGPLLVASKQPQPSPKTYFQLIDLWQHTDCEPPANLPDSMAADCGRYFPDNFTLLDQLIPFLVQHNCSAAAAKLLDETAKCVLTAEEQAHLAKLGSSLPNPAKPEPKG